MAFNGNEGTVITLSAASAMTQNYRNANPGDVKGVFYGRNVIKNILNQDGCMGIRFYYGLNQNNEQQLILVGALANEDDLESGIIADVGHLCPPICGKGNALNS